MTEVKKTGTKGRVACITFLLLLVAPNESVARKVYTNKDLQRYEKQSVKPVVTIKSSRISVDFLDAQVYQVLQVIAEEAKQRDGVEIFVSPEMSGKITIKMTNAPWTEVLREIERRHNLAETSFGKRTILIYQKR